MRWRDLFGGGQPPPQRAAPTLQLTLQSVRPLQPLPINPADARDRAVSDAWHHAQRCNPNVTWDQFIRALAATNAALATDIAKLQATLTDINPEAQYRP